MKFNFWKRFQLWRKAEKNEQLLRAMAVGMNSTVDVTQDIHILMLDYDIKDVQRVVISVKELQQFWQLADAFIFRTAHGHHAIFFYDQMPYGRVRMIVDYARDVDPMFKYISRYHDHKTLRVAGKHKQRDIFFERIVAGKRIPTPEEVEMGQLKRKEHLLLTTL